MIKHEWTEEEIKDITKEVAEIRPRVISLWNNGVLNMVSWDGVHISEKLFRAMFTDYETRERDDPAYPFEVSAILDGIKYFCITNDDVGF